MKIFSERLKQLRVDKEISQAKLALMFDVAQQTVDRWEQDKTEPDMKTITRLAIYFDVSTDYLLGMTNNMYYNSNDTVATINIGGNGNKISGNVKINNNAKK